MKLSNPLVGLAGAIAAALTVELNSLVSSIALPDITAALGMSHDAATWFTTAYACAVVTGMALSPWLSVTFTLRRVFLSVVVMAMVTTLLVPLCPNLASLYAVRALQGLAQGLTIPLLMTTALRVLAPRIRLYGLATYALTATFFPNLGFSIAALWVDKLDWHFVFYQVVPLGSLAWALLWCGMPHDSPRYERIRVFDWQGLLLLSSGATALTIVLEQGDRLDWFASPLIVVLAAVALVALPLFLVNEWFHPLPLLKLQLLERRNFAYAVTTLFLFMIIGMSSTELPFSFLTEVAGYRPIDANWVTLEIACTQLLFLPLMAVILNIEWVDARWVSFAGLSLILAACLGASHLDSSWNRNQFYLWQLMQSLGEAAVVLSMLMMGTNTVRSPHEGPFASAMINAPRAVAETVGFAVLTLVGRLRGSLHWNRMADRVGLDSGQGQGLSAAHGAVGTLAEQMHTQVAVLTLSDDFLVIAGIVAALMVWMAIISVRTYPPRIAYARR